MFFGIIEWILDFLIRTYRLMQAFQKQKSVLKVNETIQDYNKRHSQESSENRTTDYMTLVNEYYDVSTAFYEWGWGSSFHFGVIKKYETLQGAILRHECRLADRLRLQPRQKVLDVGCGIGGPLRNIARLTGAHITGINNNGYQIQRGNEENKAQGLSDTCQLVKEDFCKMTFPDNSFDAVYAIEATCHAPRREDVFGQIFRVLKPGGYFGVYEWCLTDQYDEKNAKHREIKKQIEIGNGLPDMINTHGVSQAIKNVGFEILESSDYMEKPLPEDIPWYDPIQGTTFPPHNFTLTPIGKQMCLKALGVLEKVGVAPLGSVQVNEMLYVGADGLCAGGRERIFTPAYFVLCQKPKN